MIVYISASMLYEYGENELKRVKKALDLIKSYKDDTMCTYVADPLAEDVLLKYRPEVLDAYKEFIGELEVDDDIDVYREVDIDELVNLCDMMYGDAGVLMNECRIAGKPVLWETPGTEIVGRKTSEKKSDEDLNIALSIVLEGTTEGRWSLEEFMDNMIEKSDHKVSEHTEYGKLIYQDICSRM